jgi:hypothetical protein
MTESGLIEAYVMTHDPYRCGVHRAGALTLTSSVNTAWPYDTVDYDPNSNFTTGVGAHYTAPQNGYYNFSASTLVTGTAAGQFIGLAVAQNKQGAGYATVYQGQYSLTQGVTNIGASVSAFGILATAGDLFQIQYLASAALVTAVSFAFNWAQIEWAGPS